MYITDRQRAIIIGTLLGDGYIYRNQYGSSYLEVKHAPRDGEYVRWMHHELRSLCRRPPYQRSDNGQWRFYTKYDPVMTVIHNRFYGGHRKCVPLDIARDLRDPIAVAVWYMDDGSLDYRPKSHCAFAFSTNAFTYEENTVLAQALRENFGIVTRIDTPTCRGKRYPELAIAAKSRQRFLELVKPHILPCFQRKLPPQLDPSETESRSHRDEIVGSRYSGYKQRSDAGPPHERGEDIVQTHKLVRVRTEFSQQER